MDCFVCGKPIVRRYFKKPYNGEDRVICPVCNKKWDTIEIQLLLREKDKKEDSQEVTNGENNSTSDDIGLSE